MIMAKISFKKIFITVVIVLVCVIGFVFYYQNEQKQQHSSALFACQQSQQSIQINKAYYEKLAKKPVMVPVQSCSVQQTTAELQKATNANTQTINKLNQETEKIEK